MFESSGWLLFAISHVYFETIPEAEEEKKKKEGSGLLVVNERTEKLTSPEKNHHVGPEV